MGNHLSRSPLSANYS